jgi:hypothetical protein
MSVFIHCCLMVQELMQRIAINIPRDCLHLARPLCSWNWRLVTLWFVYCQEANVKEMESKGFWQWCMTELLLDFWTLSASNSGQRTKFRNPIILSWEESTSDPVRWKPCCGRGWEQYALLFLGNQHMYCWDKCLSQAIMHTKRGSVILHYSERHTLK